MQKKYFPLALKPGTPKPRGPDRLYILFVLPLCILVGVWSTIYFNRPVSDTDSTTEIEIETTESLPAGAAAIASAVVSLIDTADASPQHITVQGGDQKNVQGDQTLSNKISLPPININVVNINNFDASGENEKERKQYARRVKAKLAKIASEKEEHASRQKRELLSTSLASATAIVAIPTALVIGEAAVGGALVSALITWGLISDSDLMDTLEELCEGRERACLAKLQMVPRKRAITDLPLISQLKDASRAVGRWIIRLCVEEALKEVDEDTAAEE
ncbi:hypothetical protein QR680_006795 [Steinernema hermaphroditum]|uniref:Uncharacterized protein n=1 Tax=Steinernema hermaphroditum TaxID=289476 RepID=A0AA39HWN3_9BILA|nr:hypothetical protein QR680_006795 [Steinernema hermaphroditum]